jgi:hypothetical protein|nr:MAG TPA: hypothetical protein [Caudoviricetes sp.]
MIDKTYIFGQDIKNEWMVHISTVDESTGQRYEYYAFFENRAKADTYVKGIVITLPDKNVIIRMTKVECFDNIDILRIY